MHLYNIDVNCFTNTSLYHCEPFLSILPNQAESVGGILTGFIPVFNTYGKFYHVSGYATAQKITPSSFQFHFLTVKWKYLHIVTEKDYPQNSDIRRKLVGNTIVDHSDVVGLQLNLNFRLNTGRQCIAQRQHTH